MTEAVAYTLNCLGHTNLKPDEAHIYLYDIVVWSGCLRKQQLI